MGINNLFNITNFMIQVDWTVHYIHTLLMYIIMQINVSLCANVSIYLHHCLHIYDIFRLFMIYSDYL
jgi:hypothetical protein